MSEKFSSSEEEKKDNLDSNEFDNQHPEDFEDEEMSEERKYWHDMFEDEEEEYRFRDKKGKKKGK